MLTKNQLEKIKEIRKEIEILSYARGNNNQSLRMKQRQKVGIIMRSLEPNLRKYIPLNLVGVCQLEEINLYPHQYNKLRTGIKKIKIEPTMEYEFGNRRIKVE